MNGQQTNNGKTSVGDVYYTSWGYDQTNYDYIIVKEVSKSGKSAKCQMAKAKHLGTSGTCNIQKPQPEGFGDMFRMLIQKKNWGSNRESVNVLRGSYPFCEGSKRLDTFMKWDGERSFYETDMQFGH